MSRKLIVLFILVLFAVSATFVTVDARNYDAPKVGGQYNFNAQRHVFNDNTPTSSSGKVSGPTSLGAYTTQGIYPGYILGYTWRDDQSHFTAAHMVDWGGVVPMVHFVFMKQICNGDADVCSRFYDYNYWNPTQSPGGVMGYGANGLAVQDEPLVRGGLFPQLAVDEVGAAILTGETFDAAAGGLGVFRRTETYWDVSPYGNFIGDTLPGERVDTADIDQKYPRIEYQQYGDNYVTHLLVVGDTTVADSIRYIMYWRKSAADPRTEGTWVPMVIDDQQWSNTYTMAAAHDGSGEFGIAFLRPYKPAAGIGPQEILVMLSHDAGANFDPTLNLQPKDTTTMNDLDVFFAWEDLDALIDEDGYFHLVWNAGNNGVVTPARIFHWTNRVPGITAGGKLSLATIYDPDYQTLCGVGHYNDMVLGKPVITECNGRLYTIWKQFGNDAIGDTANCCADDLLGFQARGNASLYMSVSLSLDGSLWDAKRLLTPGTTPDCDTVPGNECSHANYPSVARRGMNTAAFGSTFWTNAPQAFEVRDNIAPGYAEDGYYVDVQYVNDLFPENARYEDNYWTNNPIKWFRLPCVDAVVAPAILIDQPDFLFPTYWVKLETDTTFDIKIQNIGNDTLHVSNIETDYIQSTGWLSISPTSINVLPGDSDFVTATILGSPITTARNLEADVIFHNDSPDRDSAYVWQINTVVADTVVPVIWDTIATGMDMKLMMANNGSAGYLGNNGDGGANLDFYASTQGDCDSGQGTVYLYDLTPVIMLSADSGDYWWQPFWRSSNTHDFNFVVVPSDDGAKKATGSVFSQYRTEKFVTSDSAIAMVKTWVAPNTSSSYMLERIQVFSNDGGTYNDVKIGEWIDWDIPSDTAATNQGGFVHNVGHYDYMYQQGYNFGDPDACIDNSTRFGASGMLGWYYTSDYNSDPNVNNTGLFSGWVQLDVDIFGSGSDESFIADSAWKCMTTSGVSADHVNNSDVEDQQIWLSFGGFTISSTDTLTIWAVHASVVNGDETVLQGVIDDAEAFYLDNRADVGAFGCCGLLNGGHTGNTNCSAIPAGETRAWPDLADITQLIDRVYISQKALCCEENGDVNASGGDPDLADITTLIDHVYISQKDTPLCP